MTTTAVDQIKLTLCNTGKIKVQLLGPQLMPMESERGRSFVVHKMFLELYR